MRILSLFIVVGAAVVVTGSPLGSSQEDLLKVSISNHKTGKEYHLNLVKPKSSVIHPNIQIVNVVADETGNLNYHRWTPSGEDFDSVMKSIHVDPKHLAVVKVTNDEDGRQVLHGVVDGMTLEDHNGTPLLLQRKTNLSSDYITVDPHIQLEPSVTIPSAEDNDTSIIVEIAVVCDLDFGKMFNFNRRQILEYWTVYFWDINMRFKNLPSSDISLRVTSITVIETPSGQPFIEGARSETGAISYNRALGPFGDYMYSQLEFLPKFDMAMAVTNTAIEWAGGLAYLKTACNMNHGQKRHYGVLIYDDYGGYTNTYIAVHEIAHVLGAHHDRETAGCEDYGFIMGEYWSNLQWFFSSCSDRSMRDYVHSPSAACLRQIDETGELPVDPDFSSFDAPTMTEQCQARRGNSSAFVFEDDTALCTSTRCVLHQGGGSYSVWAMTPIQNSPCLGGGRCFHGRCLAPNYLLVNVGSGQCVRRSNGFSHNDEPEMVECPKAPTPLDKFMILNETEEFGVLLGTPFIIPAQNSTENADKCMWTSGTSDVIAFDRCDAEGVDLSKLGWDFINTGNNGEFMIRHHATGKCVQQAGNTLKSVASCNVNERANVWKLI